MATSISTVAASLRWGARGIFASRTFEDLGDCILMPGLINAHCHLDFTVMRGAILQQESFSHWVRRINDLKRTLTDEDYLQSIFNGFAELRRWGTTTVFNIESFPELMVHMPPPLIRAWWFYELIDVRNRIHTEEVVAGALTFFEKHPNWLGGFGLSPHAPYTTSGALYKLAKFCCEKYAMPWTTHLAETDEEFEMFVSASGPLHDFLKSLGPWHARCWRYNSCHPAIPGRSCAQRGNFGAHELAFGTGLPASGLPS